MGHYGLLNNQKGNILNRFWCGIVVKMVLKLTVDLIVPEDTLAQSFEDAEDQLNDNELA